MDAAVLKRDFGNVKVAHVAIMVDTPNVRNRGVGSSSISNSLCRPLSALIVVIQRAAKRSRNPPSAMGLKAVVPSHTAISPVA